MFRFHWSFKGGLEYLNNRKVNIEITKTVVKQLS